MKLYSLDFFNQYNKHMDLVGRQLATPKLPARRLPSVRFAVVAFCIESSRNTLKRLAEFS